MDLRHFLNAAAANSSQEVRHAHLRQIHSAASAKSFLTEIPRALQTAMTLCILDNVRLPNFCSCPKRDKIHHTVTPHDLQPKLCTDVHTCKKETGPRCAGPRNYWSVKTVRVDKTTVFESEPPTGDQCFQPRLSVRPSETAKMSFLAHSPSNSNHANLPYLRSNSASFWTISHYALSVITSSPGRGYRAS